MRTRAERRKNDFNKAIRKKNIVDDLHGYLPEYDNLHQYSKNKIHCSCPSCSVKTGKYNNSFQNYKHSDQLKIASMNSKLTEI